MIQSYFGLDPPLNVTNKCYLPNPWLYFDNLVENVVMNTTEINSTLVIISETCYFFLFFLEFCCPVSVLIQNYTHAANTGLCNLELVHKQYSSFNH